MTFSGQVQDPLGEGLYGASDIVCQVSRWEEAFGLTIAEAMASARPVIATRVGGIPELVAHGEYGYLVERGDYADLADKIVLLAEDHQFANRWGRRATESVERNSILPRTWPPSSDIMESSRCVSNRQGDVSKDVQKISRYAG